MKTIQFSLFNRSPYDQQNTSLPYRLLLYRHHYGMPCNRSVIRCNRSCRDPNQRDRDFIYCGQIMSGAFDKLNQHVIL